MSNLSPDEYANAMLATGGLFAALSVACASLPEFAGAEVVARDGAVTNQLRVRFTFLASPYLLTVERDTSEDEYAAVTP